MEAQQRHDGPGEDGVLTRIGQAIMLHHGGDREEARARLTALWTEIGPHADAFHRCTLAHYLADTQDDPLDELGWDLRALNAAQEEEREEKGDEKDGEKGDVRGDGKKDVKGDEKEDVKGDEKGAGPRHALRALLPALHFGLAVDYARLAREREARSELVRARRALAALEDDPHRQGIRADIERLQRDLDRAAGHRP